MRLLSRLVALLIVATLASLSVAQQQYAATVQNIKVGVVWLASAKQTSQSYGRSAGPFAFYNLDSALAIKPAGWNLYNPHAPGLVTPDMVSRWTEIENGDGASDIPVLGAPISKRNAEYWAVYLDQMTDQMVSDYDVLLINPYYFTQLNTAEVEKLTKFVDKGGVLWIDPAGSKNQRNGGLDYQNQYPIAFTTVTASGIPDFDSSSSILSLPLNITASDLNYLHGQTYGAIGLQAMDRIRPPGGQNINSLPLEYQFFRYLPAAVVGDKPTIAVARLGQGAVAVTSEGASLLLNRVAGGTFFPAANQFPYSVPIFGRATNTSYTAQPPVLENDAIAAAKLGINIISLASDYGQDGGGPRKTNSNAIDVTAPVLPNFSDESADGASTDSPPVSYKGVIVKSGKAPDGTYRIWVYDAIPGRDLDHDGDPDDGIVGPDTSTRTGTVNNAFRDLSIGKPYDLIWESVPINGPVSAPTCAEVGDAQTNNYGIPKDQVLVVDGTGKLIGFDLFMRTRHGQLVGGPPSIYPHKYAFACNPPSGMGAIPTIPQGEVPMAPTVSDDLAFISVKQDSNGPVGAIWVADLTRGIKIASDNTGSGMQWYVGGTNAQGQHYPGYTASPTVGYIPIQDNSGGYDKVVYTPGLDDRGHPCFNSVWLGAKGENPFTWDISGDDLTVTTRAASQGNLSIYAPDRKETPPPGDPARWNLLPKLTLLDANGNPLPPSVAGIQGYTSGSPGLPNGGTLKFTVNGARFADGTVKGVRIDYTIDWGLNPTDLSLAIERGRMILPNDGTDGSDSKIFGNIALTPQGTLCFTSTNSAGQGGNGSLWWIKENAGRGNFNVIGRWSLYSKFELPLNPSPMGYKTVLEDNDPVNNFLPGGGSSDLTDWTWTGPPSVLGDQVIATAQASKPLGASGPKIPVTVVMAFKAEPPTPQIHAINFPVGFSFAQPDVDRGGFPDPPTPPTTLSVLTQGALQYDATTGTVQIPNLASVTKGQITDCLNMSLPIMVRGSSGDNLYEPELHGENWSPLEWYCTYNGLTSQTAPLITGNTVFIGGQSVVPSLLAGASTLTQNAVINAMDVTIPLNDPSIIQGSDRSWENQVRQFTPGSGSNLTPNPHIRMPSTVGITSFNDYKTRQIQSVLGKSTIVKSLAGGGDVIAASGDAGIYSLGRADFLICDQSRVLRTDSDGQALFTSNANVNAGPTGGNYAGNVVPMVRPNRAYPISDSEMLVVDTGSNRVLRTNNVGVEERAVSKFFADPNHKPLGYEANEPLTFNAPRDAITYSNFVYKDPSQPEIVTNQQAAEYWVHYLVADSGNHRLVEVIDRYTVTSSGQQGALVTVQMPDPNAVPTAGAIPVINVPQQGVLFWQSPPMVSGKGFDYNSITRVFMWSSNTTDEGRYVYVAGVGATQPSRVNVGLDNPALSEIRQTSTGNGGIVIFDPSAANGIEVYNMFDMPDLTTTPFYNPNTGNFDTATPANTPAQGARSLSGVTSVTARSIADPNSGQGALAIMVTEATGVYEFLVDPTATNKTGDLGTPDWFINGAAYTAMRGAGGALGANAVQFQPAYARRLESGNVLVVNSYNGLYRDGTTPYHGEVLLLQGESDSSGSTATNGEFALGKQNLGFDLFSILFTLPHVSNGVRDLVAPVFADRR